MLLGACGAPATSARDGNGGTDAGGEGGTAAAGGATGHGGDGTAGMSATGGTGGGASNTLSPVSGWRSAMYPNDWTPADTDAEGRFIHDFSYAGYHRGEAPIPTAIAGLHVSVTDAPYNADPTGSADATLAIQQAIDDVGMQGGGVVFLPPGTYRVKPQQSQDTAALYIKHDGVVVRGAGRAATFVFNDETMMRGRSVVRITPSQTASWWYDDGDEVVLSTDADNRATTVELADASAYAVGDWIVLRADATAAWVAEHNMTGLWDASLVRGPMALRKIVAIAGDVVTLDIPLRYPLLTRDAARVLRARTHLHEVGLEDFSIGGREHPGSTGWGDTDYSQQGTSAYDVHGAWLIKMLSVVDGWVLRIGSYRPSVNGGNYHSVSNGIHLFHTRNVTVADSVISHPQYEGGGGNGYPFLLQGSDNLIDNCAVVSARHAYSLKSMTTSGNVLRNSSSSDARYGTDFHMHLAMSNLIDNVTMNGDYIDATYRPYGSAHGYTTTQTAIWNTRGLAYHLDKDFIVDSRQFDWGLAIGSRGPAYGIQTTPLVDTKDTSPEDYLEGRGHSGSLLPQSLYADQLHRRLNGGQAPEYLAELSDVGVSEDTFTRGGSYAGDNYGAEQLLHVKDASADFTRRAYLKFDLSGINRPIVRAVLLVYGGVADQGGTEADLRLHAINDDDWDQNAMVWDNQPSLGAYLARQTVDTPSAWRVFDVTQFAYVQQQTDGVLSLALTQAMAGDGLFVQLNSSESDQYHPRLEVALGPDDPLAIATASGEVTDPGTSAQNVLDGDLTTRWSNDNYGAALELDLGQPRQLDGAGVGFYQGAQRIAHFELRASTDRTSWTTVYAGNSSGDSSQLHFYSWPTLTARYLRLVGFGNSINDWNSVTEVRLYGQ